MSELLGKTYEEEVFERGQALGLAKGKAEATRAWLDKLLRKRFGEVPEVVQQRLASADLAQLETAFPRVLDISSPDELFA